MARYPFTHDNNISTEVSQPQLTIRRHRLNGPRESEKFNLESHQFYNDVKFIHAGLKELNEDINEMMQVTWATGELPGAGFQVEWEAGAVDFFRESMSAIIHRIEGVVEGLKLLGAMDIAGIYPSLDLFPGPNIYPLTGAAN